MLIPHIPAPAESGPVPDAVANAIVTIHLDGAITSQPGRADETVLETARRAGLTPPFSCEAGNCGTCMATLVDGRVAMKVNDALTDDDLAAGYILTCQALPQTTSITVQYP
ncbi:2Fe-2S iron-sulfur cluster-binding protein [Nocardia sp. NPDC050412]|uniref:2Fe-2S iron-sulfur cluster-binding protein n=1 Tax=Nocardia sp. NPDC050412 TaxID=3364320 RepID=UPI0037A3D4F9